MKPLKARKKEHGQTSVEYLVLLAIAIVIAVVAVGVLSGFIKIGTATTYKKKGAVYWKSADIGIMDWEIYDTAIRNSTLIIQNNRDYQITIDWVSINGGTLTYALDVTLLPGEFYKWQADQPFDCVSGSSYSYELTFQYRNLEHDVSDKLFSGVERLSGSCSS